MISTNIGVKLFSFYLFVFPSQIRFLCLTTLLVLCLIPNQVLLYSPFRFRFRAFPGGGSSNLVPNSNQGFRFPQKRTFSNLECGGMYDPSIFAQLDGICEDCYNLYRSPEVHGLCRYLLASRPVIWKKKLPKNLCCFFPIGHSRRNSPIGQINKNAARSSLLSFFSERLFAPRIIHRKIKRDESTRPLTAHKFGECSHSHFSLLKK